MVGDMAPESVENSLSVSTSAAGDHTLISVSGEVDAASADSLRSTVFDVIEGGQANVKIDMSDLPRGLQRRLAQRAIGETRRLAGIEKPDWTPDANIEPLLDALALGKAATQAGVLVRASGETWQFRVAPPRRSD